MDSKETCENCGSVLQSRGFNFDFYASEYFMVTGLCFAGGKNDWQVPDEFLLQRIINHQRQINWVKTIT